MKKVRYPPDIAETGRAVQAFYRSEIYEKLNLDEREYVHFNPPSRIRYFLCGANDAAYPIIMVFEDQIAEDGRLPKRGRALKHAIYSEEFIERMDDTYLLQSKYSLMWDYYLGLKHLILGEYS